MAPLAEPAVVAALAEPMVSAAASSVSQEQTSPAEPYVLADAEKVAQELRIVPESANVAQQPHVLPEIEKGAQEPHVLAEAEQQPGEQPGVAAEHEAASPELPTALATAEPEALVEPEEPPTVAAEPRPWVGRWRPTTVAFAYSNSHPVEPLAASIIEPTAPAVLWTDTASDAAMPLDAQSGSRAISRLGLCSVIVSAARGYDLPVPFFANLIWQESNFHLREISNAGALGVAQFIPETATEHGLINPFEPIHAIYTAGKFLRRLQDQFRNLGFAAAAYNAGPGRVNEWLTKRRPLPAETRAYVSIITGHRADQWASGAFKHDPESRLMPAKAPCPEVAVEVQETAKLVRIAKLMGELAAAAKPPPVAVANAVPLPRPNPHVAKLNDRLPASPSPTAPKPAREVSLIERIFGGKAATAEPARHPAVAQVARQAPKQVQVNTSAHEKKQAQASGSAHDKKSRAIALRSYASR